MKTQRYTEEEKRFLLDNTSQFTYKELVDEMRVRFGRIVTVNGLRLFCTKVLGVKAQNRFHHKFTDAEKRWLQDHVNDGTYEKITALFNSGFRTSISEHSIKDVCTKVLKLKKAENAGQFLTGGGNSLTYQIGTERKYDGYCYVKVNNKDHPGKTTMKLFRENWKPKHELVYEQAYGKIHENHFVVFLDTNKENFALENLYCIHRGVLAIMNKNRWFTSDPELTITAIKWCKLKFAIKEVDKSSERKA